MDEEVSLAVPKTYFDLISKVGSKGPYQRNIFLLFAMNWAVAAFLLLGTSFLFMNPKFDCEAHNIETDNCEETICAMDQSEWVKYLKEPDVHSLATQFGPFLCDKLQELNAFRMILYVGTFAGYLIFLFFTDNFGRKFSLVLTWSVTMFGISLLCIAPNITVANIGLFLAGMGCESAIRINMAILGQIVDYYRRQSYSIALEMAFGGSGILVGVLYWLFRHWRYITIAFCGIPGFIVLFFMIFYFEETPKFLVTKKGIQKTVKSINKIGKINQNRSDLITPEDVQRVYENQECGGEKFNFVFFPWHLITFKSLRKHTICCSLIFLFITYLYFGPIVIVDDLGISPFLAQILVSASQLIAYPFSFWFIQKMPRIKSGIICFSLSSIFTGILIFVVPPEDCEGCFQTVLRVILIFASRFIVSFYFSVFFLYVTEIYPLRARGLGFGIASAFGAIASSSGQFIFEEMQERGSNPMILFTVFAILGAVVLLFEDQTLNKPLKNEIQEIQEKKNEQKMHQSTKNDNQSSDDENGRQSHRNSLREEYNQNIQMVNSQSQDKQPSKSEQDEKDDPFVIG